MTIEQARPAVRGNIDWPRLSICMIFGLLLLVPKLVIASRTGAVNVEDDAYYYFVIARNLITHGISSFDGQTLTNGYHPLWLIVVALQYLVVGQSLVATLVVETLLLGAALWLLLGLEGVESPAARLIMAAGLFGVTAKLGLTGMEISLLLFTFALLLAAMSARALDADRHAILVGAAAALCISARIDAALFVLPLVILGARSTRATLISCGIVLAAGLAYAVCNIAIFDAPLPISGSIKSLGGFQLNDRLIAQFTAEGWSGLIQLAALAGGSVLGAAIAVRGSLAGTLLVSVLIGLALYATRLLLFSSWSIWSWYWYPQFFAVTGIVLAVLPRLEQRLSGIGGARLWLLAVACLAIGLASAMRPSVEPQFLHIRALHERAIAQLGSTLQGARVAMGDRAGSFGWLYPGPVTQLEGIVNDKTYLTAIKRGEPLKPLLCRRGVRYLIDWDVDFGQYTRHALPIFEHKLTSYPSPTISVDRSAEIARIRDTRIFNPGDGINTLYVWRLDGC